MDFTRRLFFGTPLSRIFTRHRKAAGNESNAGTHDGGLHPGQDRPLCGAPLPGEPLPAALQHGGCPHRGEPAGRPVPGRRHLHGDPGLPSRGLLRRHLHGRGRGDLPLLRLPGDGEDAQGRPQRHPLRPALRHGPDPHRHHPDPHHPGLDGHPGGGHAPERHLHPHLLCRQPWPLPLQLLHGHHAGGGRQPPSPLLPHHLLRHQCLPGPPLHRGLPDGGGRGGPCHHPGPVPQRRPLPAAALPDQGGPPPGAPGDPAGPGDAAPHPALRSALRLSEQRHRLCQRGGPEQHQRLR